MGPPNNIFVAEEEREIALAMELEFLEKLLWGTPVRGLRVPHTKAKPTVVTKLLLHAWSRKAPKSLLAGACTTLHETGL